LCSVLLSAGGDVDFTVPVAENGDHKRSRGSEAEEPDTLAGLGAGDTNAAEADHAGAEQRGDVGVGERGG